MPCSGMAAHTAIQQHPAIREIEIRQQTATDDQGLSLPAGPEAIEDGAGKVQLTWLEGADTVVEEQHGGCRRVGAACRHPQLSARLVVTLQQLIGRMDLRRDRRIEKGDHPDFEAGAAQR